MRTSTNPNIKGPGDLLSNLPEWDDWGEARPTKENIIEKYRPIAIKAMLARLDEEDKAKTTEEDIIEWALDAAIDAKEVWRE